MPLAILDAGRSAVRFSLCCGWIIGLYSAAIMWLLRSVLQHVTEEVNRKCPSRNTIIQLSRWRPWRHFTQTSATAWWVKTKRLPGVRQFLIYSTFVLVLWYMFDGCKRLTKFVVLKGASLRLGGLAYALMCDVNSSKHLLATPSSTRGRRRWTPAVSHGWSLIITATYNIVMLGPHKHDAP